MTSCWQNDPDARPTFIELRNQLKDMETLHKVRRETCDEHDNLRLSFHVSETESLAACSLQNNQ